MTVSTETTTISEVPEIVKSMARPPRVMVTKIGLDGHDRDRALSHRFYAMPGWK